MKSQVVAAFQSSLLPDSNTVKAASQAITEMSRMEGFCLSLMEVIDDASINVFVRQAALIQLKNNIERRWRPIKYQKVQKDPPLPLTQPEKAKIREYLLPALVRCQGDSKFLKLYKTIVQLVTGYDYAEWLPLQEITVNLQTANCNLVLHFLLAMLTAFELSMSEYKPYQVQIVNKTFPVLLQLGQAALPTATVPPNPTLFLVFKCYWKGTHMQLPDSLKSSDLSWMTLLGSTLAYNNAQLNQRGPTHNKQSVQSYYFRTKKVVARILLKYYQKHANGKYHSSNEPYAAEWMSKYNETFLQQMFNQLTIPNLPKTQYFLMKSFASLGYYRPQLIEGYVGPLLSTITPPFLQMKPEDEKTANDDPLELIRREDDYTLTFTNTKMAATDVWICLCEIPAEPKPVVSPPAATNGKYILQIFQFLKKSIEENNLLNREMAMYLFCKLRVQFCRNAAIKQYLPQMIEQLIVPQLNSEVMFLRARAMEAFISYGDIKFTNFETLKIVVEAVFRAIANDTNTIVKVKAACAFNCLLKHKEAIELVKPYLNQILEIYLGILSKYDLEELVESLSGIVENFSKDIGPYALDLTKHLTGLFHRYAKEDLEKMDNDDYNGQLQEAACGVVSALRQIVEAKLSQETLVALEDYICGIVSFSFTLDGSDYFSQSMPLLNSYVYSLKQYSPRVWFFYPTLIYSVMGTPDKPLPQIPTFVEHQTQIFANLHKMYNSENLEQIVPVLCNYLYKGLPQVTKQMDYYGSNLIELLFKLVERVYRQHSEDAIVDLLSSCQLMTFIMENFRPLGKIVVFVSHLAKFNLTMAHSKTLRIYNLQMFCIGLFNSPTEMVAAVSKDNYWDKIVASLKKYRHLCEQDWERQRLIIGLSSFLIVPDKPENAQQHTVTIFTMLIELVVEAYNERLTDEQDKEEEDSKSSKPFEPIATEASVQSDDFYWKQEHNSCYASRLTFYDELIYFGQAMKMLKQQKPQQYTALIELVEQKHKDPLNKAVELGRKLLLQKQEQQQAALQKMQQQQSAPS